MGSDEEAMEEGGFPGEAMEEGRVSSRRGKVGPNDSSDSVASNNGPEGWCDKEGVVKCLLHNLLIVLLLIGIIIGILIGVCVRKYNPDWSGNDMEAQRLRMYLKFPGDLFIRMLKCMIIPLIISSLISGMAGLPAKSRGRLGGFAMLYYMATTFIAVIIGILLVISIRPGRYAKKEVEKERIQVAEDFILDLIRNIFPDNIVAATFKQTKTSYDFILVTVNKTYPNGTTYEETRKEISSFKVIQVDGTNVLGIVVFSVILGTILGLLGEQGRALKECIDSLTLAIIGMVKLIVWFAPIGICFLLSERIVRMKDPNTEFKSLAAYMGTVIAGLSIHAVMVLPGIYFFFVRKNPFQFGYHMLEAIILALGTASSSATLPVTLKCMTLKARVDPRIANFVLPVGATINMDGTALYEAVAVIFIAQMNNIQLNVGETITVTITATAAAIGAAGVPEAGLVTMSIVLMAVNLPLDDISLIITVDWLLDRFRTAVNVWGDSIGCGVVEALTRGSLDDDIAKLELEALEEGNALPDEREGINHIDDDNANLVY